MNYSFAPLRYRSYRLLSLGRITATLGNSVAPIALAFAVLDLTGSTTSLGLVVGTRFLANVLFTLSGGILADRLPRSFVLVSSNWFSALTQATVATLVLTHTATVPWLIVLSALNGTASALALPASGALTPQTVPPEMVREAVTIVRLGMNTAVICGASLGGLFISLTSPGCGLALDAASFALAGCFFARIGSIKTIGSTGSGPGFLDELREGWAEFIARTWVWRAVVAFGLINAAFAASNQVLGPAIVDDTVGRRAWGLVLAAQTVGMLVAALVGLKVRLQRPLLVGAATSGVAALLPLTLAVSPHTLVLCAAAFVSGAGLEQCGIAWETSLQQHISPSRLARVYSYDALGSYLAIPVADVVAGPIAGTVGITAALIGAASLVVVAAAFMVGSRSVRKLRATDVPLELAAHEPEASPGVSSNCG
ncbi:MFS transporter [Streptomyces sp. 900105755]